MIAIVRKPEAVFSANLAMKTAFGLPLFLQVIPVTLGLCISTMGQ